MDRVPGRGRAYIVRSVPMRELNLEESKPGTRSLSSTLGPEGRRRFEREFFYAGRLTTEGLGS